MKLSAILAPLISAGVSGDVILATVRAYEEQASAASEEGKEKARERWRRWKNKQGTNVGKRLQTGANVSKQLARGEDNLQTKDTSGKEEKKVASPSARPSRGSRIPEDFQPDIEAAVSEGVPRNEAERQARSFCDYWLAKPGAGGLKLDWPATWRVWYRRNIAIPPKPPDKTASKPRNAGEFSRMQLKAMQDATGDENRHLLPSYGDADYPGSGIARRFALPAGG